MTSYALHFIGRGVYTPESFEDEAGRVGVARAIPARMLSMLAWDDPVLVGTWERDRALDGFADLPGWTAGERLGRADVFGLFRVEGLNVDASPEARSALGNCLTIVKVVEPDRRFRIERACGAYEVGARAYVKETIAEIAQKARKVEKELGVRIRFFVTGPFYPLPKRVRIEPVPFTRSFVRVELEVMDISVPMPEVEDDGRPLTYIYAYGRRVYVPKKEREAKTTKIGTTPGLEFDFDAGVSA